MTTRVADTVDSVDSAGDKIDVEFVAGVFAALTFT